MSKKIRILLSIIILNIIFVIPVYAINMDLATPSNSVSNQVNTSSTGTTSVSNTVTTSNTVTSSTTGTSSTTKTSSQSNNVLPTITQTDLNLNNILNIILIVIGVILIILAITLLLKIAKK